MLGIAAGNRHTILRTLTFDIKSIENCFGHHRISNYTVVTLKIDEPLHSLGNISGR